MVTLVLIVCVIGFIYGLYLKERDGAGMALIIVAAIVGLGALIVIIYSDTESETNYSPAGVDRIPVGSINDPQMGR